MRALFFALFLVGAAPALAQDDIPAAAEAPGAAEDGAEVADEAGDAQAEGEEKEPAPELSLERGMELCKNIPVMSECEDQGWIGLCQLDPCDRGWTDGAPRVCKTCVLSRKAPPPPPPEEAAEAKAKVKGKGKGKGKRRVKKRDCGCSASGAGTTAWLGLGLLPALMVRRRRDPRAH